MRTQFIAILTLQVLLALACSSSTTLTPSATLQPDGSREETASPETPLQPTQHSVFMPDIRLERDTPVSGEALPPITANPHIEVAVSKAVLKVGETLTVMGAPVEIGLPYYYLSVRDEGAPEGGNMAQVTYAGEVTRLDGRSKILEFVSAEVGASQVVFTLRALSRGAVTVTIVATGEIHSQAGATFSGSDSGSVQVTVSD